MRDGDERKFVLASSGVPSGSYASWFWLNPQDRHQYLVPKSYISVEHFSQSMFQVCVNRHRS
jgi:hypothetical protein